MMDEFSSELNNFLTSAFNSILKSEEEIIQQLNNVNITISELHLIEAVGKCKNGKNTISDIANILDITNSSVTIAVNKLIKKDLLQKSKNENDGRSVYITLTSIGSQLNNYHQDFHQAMVDAIAKHLNTEEKKVLISGMIKLNSFFEPDNFKKLLDDYQKSTNHSFL